MKIVTATFVIDDRHGYDDLRYKALEGELRRVQENSENGLVYLTHVVGQANDPVSPEVEF